MSAEVLPIDPLRDAEDSAIRALQERDKYAAETERYKRLAEEAVGRSPLVERLRKEHQVKIDALEDQKRELRLQVASLKHKLSIKSAELRLMRLKRDK